MKKVIFFFLIALFAASCSNNTVKTVSPQNHTFTFTASCDTAITVKVPVTSPIHLCSGGKSSFKKITSWKDSVIYMHSGQTITLSNEEMNDKGWYWFPKGVTPVLQDEDMTAASDDSTSGIPAWVKWAFWNMLIPALILFLAYLLGRWLWNNRSTATPANPANQGSDTVEQNRQQYTPMFLDLTVVNRMPEPHATEQKSPLFTITGGAGAMTFRDIHVHHNGDGNLKITEEVTPNVESHTESKDK